MTFDLTQSQNNFNTGIKSTNTSGFKGVVWSKAANKWQARITEIDRQINQLLAIEMTEVTS